MTMQAIRGAGLGLRRELIPQLQAAAGQGSGHAPDFLEIAPENWLGVGGRPARQLAWLL